VGDVAPTHTTADFNKTQPLTTAEPSRLQRAVVITQ